MIPYKSEFCLKAKIANYRAEKPIAKAFMTDVVFDMENMISVTKPGQLEVTTVQNKAGIPQTVTREIAYSTTSSMEFSTASSLAIDVSVTVTMKIPFTPIFVGVEASVATQTENIFGKSTEKTESDTISVDVFVPENSQISASIVTSTMESTVPYTAMLEKVYTDGTRKRERIRSQYTGRGGHWAGQPNPEIFDPDHFEISTRNPAKTQDFGYGLGSTGLGRTTQPKPNF